MKTLPDTASNNRGFSLMELALGLIILFVIGAVTMPRFALGPDNSDLDRVAATARDFQDAVREVQRIWQSQGADGSMRNLDSFSSGQIDTNELAFPVGIHDTSRLTRAADCSHLWLNVLSQAPSAWHNDHLDPDYFVELENDSCRYHYRRAKGISIVYQPRSGRVLVHSPTG